MEWALGHIKLGLRETKMHAVTGEENGSEVCIEGRVYIVGGKDVGLHYIHGQKKVLEDKKKYHCLMVKITLHIWVDRMDSTLLQCIINSQILKNNKNSYILLCKLRQNVSSSVSS